MKGVDLGFDTSTPYVRSLLRTTRYVVPAGKWGAMRPVWHGCRSSQPSLGRDDELASCQAGLWRRYSVASAVMVEVGATTRSLAWGGSRAVGGRRTMPAEREQRSAYDLRRRSTDELGGQRVHSNVGYAPLGCDLKWNPRVAARVIQAVIQGSSFDERHRHEAPHQDSTGDATAAPSQTGHDLGEYHADDDNDKS